MIINCPKCGNQIELPEGLVEGQHVQCPYCGEKFEYHAKRHKTGTGRKMVYAVRTISVICGLIATFQFVDGWLNLPSFRISSWFFGSDPELSFYHSDTTALAVVCMAKMFAGYFFVKVSRRLWRMPKR